MDSKQNLRKALAAGAVTIAALGSVILGGAGAAQAAGESITISPNTYAAGRHVTVNFSGFPANAQARRDHLHGAGDDGTKECATFGTPSYVVPVNADPQAPARPQSDRGHARARRTVGSVDCTVAGSLCLLGRHRRRSALASAPVTFTAAAPAPAAPAPAASAAATNTSGNLAKTGPGDSLALGLGGLAVIALGTGLIVNGRARRSGARV